MSTTSQERAIERTNENEEPAFLATPLDSRRAIEVVDAGADPSGATWALTGAAVGFALGGPLGAAVGGWAANAVSKKLQAGVSKFPINHLPRQCFPPGHPRVDARYLIHPVDHERYLPVADYATTIFDEKRRELTTLLLSLGARKVRIQSRRRQHATSSTDVAATAPSKVGMVKLGGDTNTRNLAELVTTDVILNTPRHEPRVPDALLWYPHEPSWQDLARTRLEQGVQVLDCQLVKRSLREFATELSVGVEFLGGEGSVSSTDTFEEFIEFHADFSLDFAPSA
jgi:hypothetical protein